MEGGNQNATPCEGVNNDRSDWLNFRETSLQGSKSIHYSVISLTRVNNRPGSASDDWRGMQMCNFDDGLVDPRTISRSRRSQ